MNNDGFHPEAATRFNDLAEEIARSVRLFPRPKRREQESQIHPVAHLTDADMIGEPTITQTIVDGTDTEIGRLLELNGQHFGWVGKEYEELQRLASRMAQVEPLRNKVSVEVVVDTLFSWLQRRIANQPVSPLDEYVVTRCKEAIKTYQMCIPLHRTHSSSQFQIGEVLFRTISKELIGPYFERAMSQVQKDSAAAAALNRLRSKLQGTLGGFVTVTAEPKQARVTAHDKVMQATALLRFISPANWTWKIRSYCVPIGTENIEQRTEIAFMDGKLATISERVAHHGPSHWNLDEVLSELPTPLPALHSLAKDHKSGLKRDLYDALLIYSRNTLATDLSDKLLFILVSLESILLKDPNEPLQKSIGERMAFIIGNSMEKRVAIAKNLEAIYNVRSRYVHHGLQVEAADVIQEFLYHAWDTLYTLLLNAEKFSTKADLISALENRKFS